jgi:hypothetical protein
VLSFRSAYEELGREQLLFFAREVAYVVLAVVLAMKGGWRSVLAAVSMAIGAITLEWILFPAAYAWVGAGDPASYAERFANFGRPS